MPIEEDWLFGWDPTPGIVAVWAEGDGVVHVWRRVAGTLVYEVERSRSWVLVDSIEGLRGLAGKATYRELAGEGALRFVVRADDMRTLAGAIPRDDHALYLPPEEQYLVATGRTYFKDLTFAELRRMQFDLETTGLDAEVDRIFLIATRLPDGTVQLLDDADERALITRFVELVRATDPDVIENHNLHGFDLPFLERRARILNVPLALGRIGPPGLRQRGARRGAVAPRQQDSEVTRRIRFVIPGRELIDTMDAVMRHDFAARDLPGHGLKAVAKHLGVAGPDREHIPGSQIHAVWQTDPDRVRRYAAADVEEVDGLARLLGGPAFALARMAPRRYERLADAGPATGVIDPLLVRAYLRSGQALPAHRPGDGTQHTGAALHLFAAGVAHRVVKADVASLYPSLMREYKISPTRDRLGALLAVVDQLVVRRLEAKAAAKLAPVGSPERASHEAMSAAMKLVVNSAYGYLGAGSLTRFADVHAANEVTRRGREVLDLMCTELAARGVTLLEADTDGVYFTVPTSWTEADERRVVAEVAALLPDLVRLEYDGRYAAMLSHEPKNYALLGYDGKLTLRGVAFRSSRAEPFGEAFLRRAIGCLLRDDVPGVRAAYLATVTALRGRELPTHEVSSLVRLTKTPDEYLAVREQRHELSYEAVLAAGRTTWRAGERYRVYRTRSGGGALSVEDSDPRDYDADHYVRLLRDTYASRLVRAFAPEDFAAVFADPDQLSLFTRSLATIVPVLTPIVADPPPAYSDFH